MWTATLILCFGLACQPAVTVAHAERQTECAAIAKVRADQLADVLPGASVQWICTRTLAA